MLYYIHTGFRNTNASKLCFCLQFVPPMPAEVEAKALGLLQALQAECCEAGAWVENKGTVLAFHHEAWRDRAALGNYCQVGARELYSRLQSRGGRRNCWAGRGS